MVPAFAILEVISTPAAPAVPPRVAAANSGVLTAFTRPRISTTAFALSPMFLGNAVIPELSYD